MIKIEKFHNYIMKNYKNYMQKKISIYLYILVYDGDKEIGVAEEVDYGFSCRFREKAPTKQEYLKYISGKGIYNRNINELTKEQVELAENTIVILKKDDLDGYKEKLLNYDSYINLNANKIIEEFRKSQPKYQDYTISLAYEVL